MRAIRPVLKGIAVIAVIWIALTVWVEMEGPALKWQVGNEGSTRSALIVYDPDPIYDLDRQVCQAFAEGLATQGIRSTIATVAAARDLQEKPDLFVLCANTYNWRPDRALVGYIADPPGLKGAHVVAITLGSGSTEASQRAFEKRLRDAGAMVIASRSFWLMRPNDEARTQESNEDVAVELARTWAAGLEVR